jgi:hypothetical protein
MVGINVRKVTLSLPAAQLAQTVFVLVYSFGGVNPDSMSGNGFGSGIWLPGGVLKQP